MYNNFSNNYDRFVNWTARLAFELPFLEKQMAPLGGSLHILDAACGTGKHAIALVQRGHRVSGADLSGAMIKQARQNAAVANVSVEFVEAGFGQLSWAFNNRKFDALLCLGNSLPHLTSSTALQEALRDFANCVRPGGLLMIQNRNFDAVLAKQDRWMEPQAYQEPGQEFLFVRFYDFLPNGLIQFNILTLQRKTGGAWQQTLSSTELAPQRQTDLVSAISSAGFNRIVCYGSLSDVSFDPQVSGNLVITAYKA
jgi:ubiquinone/menaquinone biosynthesis C-methylase UbiE